MSAREILLFQDVATMSQDMAVRFVRLAEIAIKDRGKLSFCLSGGSTPKALFTLLASDAYRTQVDWSRVHFFWGDERSVPPDHPDSNYRMANETLLSKIQVPSGNIHRMEAERSDLPQAARDYEETIRAYFNYPAGLPSFDIMLLGMGPDGHTASLFPDSAALTETAPWVVPNWVEKFKTWRMTMTYPLINESEWIFFLVGGQDKADVLKTVLEGEGAPLYPSQRVQPTHGRMLWLVESAAASKLSVAKT